MNKLKKYQEDYCTRANRIRKQKQIVGQEKLFFNVKNISLVNVRLSCSMHFK